jgi:predicted Zn-dependent protease
MPMTVHWRGWRISNGPCDSKTAFATTSPRLVFSGASLLGAMLLDAGRPNEAEVVYAADLKKNPNNGYALFGLKRALEQQGKQAEDASATNMNASSGPGPMQLTN